jgi:hypothetical protein
VLSEEHRVVLVEDSVERRVCAGAATRHSIGGVDHDDDDHRRVDVGETGIERTSWISRAMFCGLAL